MQQVEVEILGQVMTAQYGTLGKGDILKTDAAFAAHLVDDCKAAKYVKAKAATAPAKSKSKPKAQETKTSADVVSSGAGENGGAPDESAKTADVCTDLPDGAADAAA